MLYLSAFLLVLVAFVHSILGERYILTRLFTRDNLPKLFGSDDFTKRTLRFAWHLTSVAWLGFAGIVIVLAQPEFDRGFVAYVVSITFGIHCLVALLGSKGKHRSWLLFGAVSVLVLIGANAVSMG